MNIKTKLLLTVFTALLVALATISGIAVYRMHLLSDAALSSQKKALLGDYDALIKGQVQTAVSLLAILDARAVKGEITLDDAKKQGADLLRELRYQQEGYFWADTIDGVNIVLLGKPIEGKNRIELQDNHGKFLIKEIIQKGRTDGGGFTDYWFPKAGKDTPLPKRSYSLEFKPWGWVVGTGNYVDDINVIVAEQQKTAQKEFMKNATFFAITSLTLILTLIALGFLVFRIMKNSDTTIKMAEENLQGSEHRFHQMFEEHSAIMLMIEPHTGRIVDANNSAAQFYGYSLEQLRSMNISEINQLPPRRELIDL